MLFIFVYSQIFQFLTSQTYPTILVLNKIPPSLPSNQDFLVFHYVQKHTLYEAPPTKSVIFVFQNKRQFLKTLNKQTLFFQNRHLFQNLESKLVFLTRPANWQGEPSTGVDTIFSGQSISGNQTITSQDERFELGFFKPNNSQNYYIGISNKKVPVHTVVWVANRDICPLKI